MLGLLTDNRQSNYAPMMPHPIHRNSLVSPHPADVIRTYCRLTTATHELAKRRFVQCDLRDTHGVKKFLESLLHSSFFFGRET